MGNAAVQVLHGEQQHGDGGSPPNSGGLRAVSPSHDGEHSDAQSLPSAAEEAGEELRAMADVLPGGFADIARLTGFAPQTVQAWADPNRPDKVGRWPTWLKYRLPPECLLASEAHGRMVHTRRMARQPQTLERGVLKLEAVQGRLADARLTNEPAAVVRPIVRELVEAAVRIDATFARCDRCGAETYAAPGSQCDSCGLTR